MSHYEYYEFQSVLASLLCYAITIIVRQREGEKKSENGVLLVDIYALNEHSKNRQKAFNEMRS